MGDLVVPAPVAITIGQIPVSVVVISDSKNGYVGTQIRLGHTEKGVSCGNMVLHDVEFGKWSDSF